MAQDPGGEQRCGIGARLRAAREKKSLTMLQAAERLHVDARVLEQLEGEDFTALGADVYVRGHMRRYAELVGESPAELLELYAISAHSHVPDLTRIPRQPPDRSSSALVLPAAVLLVGVALAGLLWWLLTAPREKSRPVAPAPPAAASGLSAPAMTATLPAADNPGGAAARSFTPAPAGQVQLTLSFAAASWVGVSDADGRHLLQGLFSAGSAHSVNGKPPLHVVLGNAPVVALAINGQPVPVGALAHRDGSVRLLVDASGRVSAAAPRLAHGD